MVAYLCIVSVVVMVMKFRIVIIAIIELVVYSVRIFVSLLVICSVTFVRRMLSGIYSVG